VQLRRLVAGLSLATIGYSAAAARTATAQTAAPRETAAQKGARMAWWRDARFGMFIHWGLYAVPAGTWHGERVDGLGEWIMARAKIPVAEYAPLAKQFNPVQFDADAWVKTAKDAG
jgi:alpha-L-fucosidase